MKLLLPILVLVASLNIARAENYSMRSCVLLPVTDTAGNSLGYEVFEGLERYLKRAGWCSYTSSAELIGIFSKYREGLRSHLNDEKVLKTVATRMKAGTIIRLSLEYEINRVNILLDVVGDNGRDIYFSEKAAMESPTPEQITQTAKGWLELYESSIPYDGQVLGILGDQITFDYPKSKNIKVGHDFKVRRLVGKSKHPLLKKVVEWDTEMLARGQVFNVDNNQALGNVKVYEKNEKLRVGDWIVIEKDSVKQAFNNVSYNEAKANKFGKLGFASLYFDIGSTSVGSNTNDNNKATGLSYGFSAEGEVWITREYFLTGELARRLGSLKEQSGDLALNTVSVSNGVYKLGAGYKYLPLGFFYGPQINLSAGYARYSYDIEESETDGLGKNSISGFYIGVGGNMPLQKGLRIFGEAEFIPFSKFTDDDNIFGEEKSSSSLIFKGGLKYQYTPLASLDAALEVQNNSAKFNNGNASQISYRDSIVKIGGSFIF